MAKSQTGRKKTGTRKPSAGTSRSSSSAGTARRKTAARKSSAAGSRTGSKTTSRSKSSLAQTERTGRGIRALIVSSVLLVIFLCMIGVIRGAFGPAVKDIMSGVFGVSAYVAPLVIIAFTVYVFFFTDRPEKSRVIGLSAFVIFFGIITSFFSGIDMDALVEMEGNRMAYFYDLHKGPGALFGIVGFFFFKVFGTVGSIILLIIFMIIGAAFMGGSSFFELLDALKDRLLEGEMDDYDYEDNEDIRARRERIRLEREERRARDDERRRLREEKRAAEEEKRQASEEELRKERERENEERRAKAEAERAEKARQREQASDLAILSNSFKKNREDNDKNAEPPVMPARPGNLDDIHEITVIANPKLLAESSPEAVKKTENQTVSPAEGDIRELKPSNTDIIDAIKEEPVIIKNADKQVEIKPVSEEKPALEEKPVTEIKAEPEKKDTPETKSEPEIKAVDTLIADLSDMPDPVTERNVKSEEVKPVVKEAKKKTGYERPSVSLLDVNDKKTGGDSDESLKSTALLLQDTLKTFGVNAKVTDISQGPSVTRFELQPEAGTKVSKILGLTDDIKLALAAADIRIEAPIPGKAAVGIEVPNKKKIPVLIRDLLDSNEYRASTAPLTYVVGKDISGKIIVGDLAKMPHLLVAGATGSGKSVFINTIIMSILYKSSPDDVKLIMIDPKMVELTVYNGIPHLMLPVVSDPRQASAALNWAVAEMMRRYKAFSEHSVRDIKGYNDKAEAAGEEKMPKIVIIVDELADLMMVAKNEVESSICRLAQLARAAGIHLVIATQRPSVDVITGLIKANMPSRVALSVSSGTDSRTILDTVGAERLLGNGDMLFAPQNFNKPLRVQGAYVNDNEIIKVTEFLKSKNGGNDTYDKELAEKIVSGSDPQTEGTGSTGTAGSGSSVDEYFADACRFVIEKQKASSSMLQRVFKVGYNRAARIVDQMEEHGVVGAEEGTSPRKVLMNKAELEELLKTL